MPQSVEVYNLSERYFQVGERVSKTIKYYDNIYEKYKNQIKKNGFNNSCAINRWIELQTYVKYDLNATLDHASMANSLEVRVPFLDHRLVEASLTVDDKFHINNTHSRKRILKEILEEHGIAPHIWKRPKVGFSIPESVRKHISTFRITSLNHLYDRGIIKFPVMNNLDSLGPYPLRDSIYIGNSAWSLENWCKNWIDTGYVKA